MEKYSHENNDKARIGQLEQYNTQTLSQLSTSTEDQIYSIINQQKVHDIISGMKENKLIIWHYLIDNIDKIIKMSDEEKKEIKDTIKKF